MERHFAGTANVFVFYLYSKKGRSAPAHCVHGSVARLVDGISAQSGGCSPEHLFDVVGNDADKAANLGMGGSSR